LNLEFLSEKFKTDEAVCVKLALTAASELSKKSQEKISNPHSKLQYLI